MPLDNTQADDWVLPDEDTRKQASFKRNSGWTKQGAEKFRTDLSPSEEAQFKAWVKANNVPNDDGPQSDYDMRGFWKALQAKDPIATSAIDPNDKKLHYPDRWKTPYHETFSNESQWADPKKAPKWNDKDQLVGQDGKVLFDDRAHKPTEVDDWVVGAPTRKEEQAQAKKDEPATKKDEQTFSPTPVTDAIGQGAREGWRGAEPFLSDEKIDALKKTGGMTEGLAGAITAVNAAPKVLGAAIGGVEGAAYAGLSKVLPERLARDIVGMSQSLAGSPEMLRTPEAPAEVAPRPPRAEPTTAAPTPIEEAGVKPTPTPPPGGGEKPGSTPLDQAGLTPTAEPPPGPAAPAGTPPAPPEPATGTETVAQPQGDGTVTQVKVQTGGKPPGEPPQEPPKGTLAEPTSPGDFRSLFPNMTDEAFNALFREAADKVPPDPSEPVNSYFQRVRDTMLGMAGEKPKEEAEKPEAPDDWAPANPEPKPEAPEGAFGGPWEPIINKEGQPAKNENGEPIFVNQNGTRATMDNGVPYTEPVNETEKGLEPKSPDKRNPQFQTEDEAKQGQVLGSGDLWRIPPEVLKDMLGEASGAQKRDIEAVLFAHEMRERNNPVEATQEASLAMRKVSAEEFLKVPSGRGSVEAQAAYVRLRNAYEDMLNGGVPQDQMASRIADALATKGIGWSPRGAQEFVAGFMNSLRPAAAKRPPPALEPPPAEDETPTNSKPRPTPPAAPAPIAQEPPSPKGRKPGTSLVPSVRDTEKPPEPEGAVIPPGDNYWPPVKSGEVVRSQSGREMAPAPTFTVDTNRKANIARAKMDGWLVNETRKEAESKGDTGAYWMPGLDPKNISPADREMMIEYLWGNDEGPTDEHRGPKPSPAETKPATPTEHPGLVIKSASGKTTTIQPIGTVPPKPAETAAEPKPEPTNQSDLTAREQYVAADKAYRDYQPALDAARKAHMAGTMTDADYIAIHQQNEKLKADFDAAEKRLVEEDEYVPPQERDEAVQFPKWKEEHGPDGAMARVVSQALEDRVRLGEKDPIKMSDLQPIADSLYGGKLADNAYSRDRLYDAIETGVNLFISRHPERFAPTGNLTWAKIKAADLAEIKSWLPTQTVRAGDKVTLQQFSTPPDYSFAVNWIANLRPGETVIEPSAGTGGLAVHAMNAGAKVIGNEISPQRRTMMAALPFSQITAENAEQLNNILPPDIKPTAVVMNPPFSSAGDRMGGKMVLETGAVHIEQALARLEPGGRLVAIVGDGMKPAGSTPAGGAGPRSGTGAAFKQWWEKIGAQYDVRANVGMGGKIYTKYGTSFPTRVLVIDKVPPSGREIVKGDVQSADELLDMLSGVRDDRPRSAGQQVADQPSGAPVAEQGPGASGPTGAIRPPTGIVGAGNGQTDATPAPGPKPADTGGGQTGGIRTGNGAGVSGNGAPVQQPQPLPPGGNGQSGQQSGQSPQPDPGSPGGDTSHIRPDGSNLAVTPPPPALLETSVIVPEEQTGGELTESVYEDYKPQRVSIEGAKPHPGPLVQSAAMASVMPPIVTYQTAIPKKLIESGALSEAQLEPIIYAGAAHAQMLPKDANGVTKRRGFFIGDGTGVGKGREVAGIILDNKWQGRKKAVWVSEKMPLSNDAKRDWSGLGQNPNEILVHNKIKAGDKINHEGILFTTYDTVKSGEKLGAENPFKVGDRVHWKSDAGDASKTQSGTIVGKQNKAGQVVSWPVKPDDGSPQYNIGDQFLAPEGKPFHERGKAAEPKTRVQQIVDWLGKDFDGVIAFDESHNMGNAIDTKGTRGAKEASAKALAGLELQNALPNARVVYVSATGATEVSNLAYADRLGLWGPGTAFPTRANFLGQVSGGGVAAMELVARDMKALGSYAARSLSYDGVEYDRVQHDLTDYQGQMYDKLADAWQLVLRNFMAALQATGGAGKGGPKGAILSAFWGGHQRFFNQLITSLQMPSVIKGIDEDLAAGRQAVLQLVNTNEAGQERALEKARASDAEDLEELDMSPKDQLMQLVGNAFPTRQFEEYTDDNGNIRVRPVVDSQGNPVHNQEAIAAKKKLLLDLGSINVPDGPLEILINHYGPDAVAEVTGRKRRVVSKPNEKGKIVKQEEKRGANANVVEADAFQSQKKKILIFSQAGGTGRSYHDDKAAPWDGPGSNSGARRSHYLVQAGWRADAAVQGFGRTHRTNQFTAPIFHLVTTNLEGQKRFISSIARRLGQLGALTKGERRTGDQGMFGLQDNLESDEAKAGLVQLFRDIHDGNVEGVTSADLESKMGLSIEDPTTGGLRRDLPPMTQFLNRVLSLRVDDQNRIFNEFATRFRDIIDRAVENGTLDAGTETYKADKIVKVRDQVVFTDPNSGAETRHVHLVTHNRNFPVSYEDVFSGQSNRTGWRQPLFFVKNNRSGLISVVSDTTLRRTEANGEVTQFYRVGTPLDQVSIPMEQLNEALDPARRGATPTMTRIEVGPEAKKLWDQRVAATPEFRQADLHIITGAILPIWDRLLGHPKIYRLQTDEGERMLGRVVDNKVVNETLKRLGAEGVKLNVTPSDVVSRVLDGATATLANGWTIKRVRVANEYRLELRGDNLWSATGELEAAGVFREQIQYNTRYFIPSGANGAAVIEDITRRRPITALED